VEEKHCGGELCLDNAFALIEGHPEPLDRTVSSRQFTRRSGTRRRGMGQMSGMGCATRPPLDIGDPSPGSIPSLASSFCLRYHLYDSRSTQRAQ